MAQVKTDKDSVEGLVQPIEAADKLFQEIHSLQKQVDDMEYKLDYRGQGVRSIEEVQEELNALQSTKYELFSSLKEIHFPFIVSIVYTLLLICGQTLINIFSLLHVKYSFCTHGGAIRDRLHNELESIREEQQNMENDLNRAQVRWHSVREEKMEVANKLLMLKKVEEELERLTEERNQLELDEKV